MDKIVFVARVDLHLLETTGCIHSEADALLGDLEEYLTARVQFKRDTSHVHLWAKVAASKQRHQTFVFPRAAEAVDAPSNAVLQLDATACAQVAAGPMYFMGTRSALFVGRPYTIHGSTLSTAVLH